MFLAGQNVITPHAWLSRADRPHQPDRLIFDFDPSPGATFDDVRAAARDAGARLRDAGLVPSRWSPARAESTSSARCAAMHDFGAAHAWAPALAEPMVADDPDHLTLQWRKADRGARIYVDVNRINYAQHAVAPYGVRRAARRAGGDADRTGRSSTTPGSHRTAGRWPTRRRGCPRRATHGRGSHGTRASCRLLSEASVGGERGGMTDPRRPATTTDSGIPAVSDEHSLTIGPSGPIALHDHYVVQKMQHFNRERVPERVVHAKGGGAHGFFEVTNDVTEFTKAAFLNEVGKRTEMFARFSTVAGEQGCPDTVRDPRGFALKFYTEDGNCDMVGNNTPVFFVRDPSKFQDFIHSQKRLPDSGLRSNDMQWDFWSLSPESAHQVTILMSDRGIPRQLAPHERLLQPHLLVGQRRRRALLGQVPLQDRPGHPAT